MFGIGKSLTAAQRRAAQKAGEKVAKGIIKAVKIGREWRVRQDDFLNMGTPHN